MKSLLILACITLYSSFALAEKSTGNTVKFCVSELVPPYSIKSTQSGLFLDIIKASFKINNSNVEFLYVPISQKKSLFNKGICTASTGAKNDAGWKNGQYTEVPIMVFFNQAITLKKNISKIKNISELEKYSVIAWEEAHKYLGKEYANMAKNNPNYKEVSKDIPSKMLMAGRVDVIISEPNVFKYELYGIGENDTGVAYIDIFPTGNGYFWVFNSKEQINTFNTGLKSLYRTGEMEEIMSKYLQKYNIDRRAFHHIDCKYGKIKSACGSQN